MNLNPDIQCMYLSYFYFSVNINSLTLKEKRKWRGRRKEIVAFVYITSLHFSPSMPLHADGGNERGKNQILFKYFGKINKMIHRLNNDTFI